MTCSGPLKLDVHNLRQKWHKHTHRNTGFSFKSRPIISSSDLSWWLRILQAAGLTDLMNLGHVAGSKRSFRFFPSSDLIVAYIPCLTVAPDLRTSTLHLCILYGRNVLGLALSRYLCIDVIFLSPSVIIHLHGLTCSLIFDHDRTCFGRILLSFLPIIGRLSLYF